MLEKTTLAKKIERVSKTLLALNCILKTWITGSQKLLDTAFSLLTYRRDIYGRRGVVGEEVKWAFTWMGGARRKGWGEFSVRWSPSILVLSYHCSVFQAEVAAIKVAANILLRSAASFRGVSIHFDSRAAMLRLSSLTVCSRSVKECLSWLEIISIFWVPDHSKAN